jgi:hypothetical protein
MILTNKEIHSLKVSLIREYYAKTSSKMDSPTFHVVAMRKIRETNHSLRTAVQNADAAKASLGTAPGSEDPGYQDYIDAVQAIEDTKQTIVAYRIGGKEWLPGRNTPQDQDDLHFMLEEITEE